MRGLVDCQSMLDTTELTDFVLVLKTRMEPDEVPMKTCFPEGSKRATVMADLFDLNGCHELKCVDVPGST